MKKTFKVVMLPTEKASRLWLRGSDNKLILENNLQHNSTTVKGCQHLYIISDDEIKEGDWFYNPATKEVLFASKDMLSWNSDTTQEHKGWKKIVATTDIMLGRESNPKSSFYLEGGLPQLPASFIQAYIKAYNEGNPITEVDLEIELHKWVGSTYPVGHRPTYQIKTRPDNTVIVHQSKMYSRDEVEKLCRLAYQQGQEEEAGNPHVSEDKWIQDNL